VPRGAFRSPGQCSTSTPISHETGAPVAVLNPLTNMTLIDPISQLPEYEIPEDGCGVQARWPELVVAARRSASNSEHSGFFEFAPLPGGCYLAGVGHERTGSGKPCMVREQILGQVIAGTDFCESVRNALGESDDGEVGYVQFDPAGDTLELCGFGPSVSAVHVTAGVARLLHVGLEVAGDSPQPFTLHSGEALVLVAHPRVWTRHLLAAVDHLLSRDLDGFDGSGALELCGRLETLLAEAGLSSVVVYRSGATTTCPWDGPLGCEDPPAAFEELVTDLTLSDLQLLDELAGCLAR
jgi:hypothetical protein